VPARAAARFGGENIEDVAGYHTKRLFVGSRGAFGAVTIAIFKITLNARIGSCDPEWK
jgi:glycolate oxidase